MCTERWWLFATLVAAPALAAGMISVGAAVTRHRLAPLRAVATPPPTRFVLARDVAATATRFVGPTTWRCAPGAALAPGVEVENGSDFVITSDAARAPQPVMLGSFLRPVAQAAAAPWGRFDLLPIVPPAHGAPTRRRFTIQVRCPDQPGEYELSSELTELDGQWQRVAHPSGWARARLTVARDERP